MSLPVVVFDIARCESSDKSSPSCGKISFISCELQITTSMVQTIRRNRTSKCISDEDRAYCLLLNSSRYTETNYLFLVAFYTKMIDFPDLRQKTTKLYSPQYFSNEANNEMYNNSFCMSPTCAHSNLTFAC